MGVAHLRLGLPLSGMNRVVRTRLPAPDLDKWAATDISGLRFEGSRSLRPFSVAASYANTLDANRVTRLVMPRWGDGTVDVVRHSHANFAELSSGAWTTRNPAAGFGASTASDYWGSDVCPGNTGKGFYVFSNRVVGPFKWDATAGVATTMTTGAPSPARHVVSYADRCFLFNQLVGGGIQGRRAQWSLPGNSDVWSGTGASFRTITEIDGEITAASVLRDALFLHSPRSIVVGTQQFSAIAPVAYTPLTRGLGSISSNPAAVLRYQDTDSFLTSEGFRQWDGQQIVPIGAPVDTYILSRLNRAALSAICGFVKPDWHIAFWALPMDGADLPTEGWAYNFALQHWSRVDLRVLYPSSSAPTAFTIVDQSSAPAWNDPAYAGVAWNDPSLVGLRWVDFAGGAAQPTVVSGHSNGVTRYLDEVAVPTVTITIETPDFTFEGTPVAEQGRSVAVLRPDDLSTLDSITLTYRTISGSGLLYALVSTDGGRTFTNFGSGSITLPAVSGDGVGTATLWGRTAGRSIRLRLTSYNRSTGATAACAIHLEDISIRIRHGGEAR